MKQSNIITVIIIATIGAVASFFACKALVGDPDEASVKFKNIKVISSDLDQPDPEVFNSYAINPTVEVKIGDCEDSDKNGIIDENERKICGSKADGGSDTENNSAGE